jgi:hypothetical protein
VYRRAQLKNYHHFDFHAFDELVRARDIAVKHAAELKSLNTSFYAPQMYHYLSNGTITTMFGQVRGRWPVLKYHKKQYIDPDKPLPGQAVVLRDAGKKTAKKMSKKVLEGTSTGAFEETPQGAFKVTPKATASNVTHEAPTQGKRQKMRMWGKSFGKSVLEYFRPGLQQKAEVVERI